MGDTQNILRKLLENIAKEQNIDDSDITIEPATSDGANYSTVLYSACIKDKKQDKHVKLFAKVANFSEELRKNALNTYYDTETQFYCKLLPIYEKLQDKNNISGKDRLFVPKFYGVNEKYMEEILVLEDLGESGFKAYDRFKSMDWVYAKSGVEEMAKLHALSLCYGQEKPDEFEEILKKQKFQIPAERRMFKKLCDGWFKGALEVTKHEYKERFINFMKKYGDMEETVEFYNPIRRAAITHGDFKITNLLYKVCQGGRLQISILDYQTLRSGSMPSDLIYFIFTSSDKEFRKKYFKKLVDHYFAKLQEATRRLNVEDVYSREDFDFEMEKVLPYGLTVAVYVLLIAMVKVEDAATVDSSTDLSAFAMKPNELYGDRLNGILEDYIQWGIL